MPSHKGIDISIISQNESRTHPEFPHPDTSQFTFRSPAAGEERKQKAQFLFDGLSPALVSSDSKADRLLGRKTAVSVYIPSLSGTRFWVRYHIDVETAASNEFIYFKLFLNGHRIASWGINPKKQPVGQVMRGLFQSNESWEDNPNGSIFRSQGVEIQRFRFAKEEDVPPSLIDGGLIEVMVYRAVKKVWKPAQPEVFKEQPEEYGIVFFSGGILSDTQHAKNFQFYLQDSRESPYAVFKFYYRPWERLVAQQLIPDDYPRDFLEACPELLLSFDAASPESALSFNELIERLDEDGNILGSPSLGHVARDSVSSVQSGSPWIFDVFVDDDFTLDDEKAAKLSKTAAYNVPPAVAPLKPRVPKLKVTAESLRARVRSHKQRDPEFLRRPLPELPSEEQKSACSRASSRTSIAPSLQSYFDRDTESPEPCIEFASAMPFMVKTCGKVRPRAKNAQVSNPGSFVGKSANVGTSSSVSTSSNVIRPFTPLAGHISSQLKQLCISPKAKALPPGIHPLGAHPVERLDPVKKIGSLQDEVNKSLASVSISVSENEWMRKTPSPDKNRDEERSLLERFWSPSKSVSKVLNPKSKQDPQQERSTSLVRREHRPPKTQVERALEPSECVGLMGDTEDGKDQSTTTVDSGLFMRGS